MDNNIRNIIFSYWSPSKEAEEQVRYVTVLSMVIQELEDIATQLVDESRMYRIQDILLSEIVTVSWGQEALKKLHLSYGIRSLIDRRNQYIRNGFNKKKAWRRMMRHAKRLY